jgi:hypothetical protein
MSGPRAASLSPDGNYGAVLSLRPSAHYLMDDVLSVESTSGRCVWGSGSAYRGARSEGGPRRLRFGDEAPEAATVARIGYEA